MTAHRRHMTEAVPSTVSAAGAGARAASSGESETSTSSPDVIACCRAVLSALDS